MTRQEAFDLSAAHLLKTREPSGTRSPRTGMFACTYSGSGCALAPFATPEERLKWDEEGAIDDLPRDWLPDFIAEDIYFYADLQAAHDNPATRGAPWFPTWLENMREIAAIYNLDPAILETANDR